jgi:SPP1 gp7 family putative phage head morphogenesis protein
MRTRNESRQQRAKRERLFIQPRSASIQYERVLRKIAEHIDALTRGWDWESPEAVATMIDTLERYAVLIGPWAEAVARRMLTDVSTRDVRAWTQLGREMGRALREEIAEAPVGHVMRAALADQVSLITSLPLETAKRVHKLTTEAITTGRRAADIADEIMRTGAVTKSRATLIARTEVARTSAALTQARAQHIGSESYQWLTANDGRVRPEHRKLNGRVFRWDAPPIAEADGTRHNPGEYPNCRCVAMPLVPAHLLAEAA